LQMMAADRGRKGVCVMEKRIDPFARFLLIIFTTAIWFIPAAAGAHCDTLDGPVVMTAKAALDKGDIMPVLKWVKKDDEAEIRDLFKKTLTVRGMGKEAKELADMYFFETLVRIHRAGEGAPYTGLKSEPAEPIIQAADKAIDSGSADLLVKQVSEAVTGGIRERFNRVKESKKHADESTEKGREFVEAYVVFTHYIERLHRDVSAGNEHHGGAASAEPAAHEHH
jgi:hypothetical protein